MKLFYYQGAEPNFGDELNAWLIPKVLPDLLDENESQILLAIGSVLYDSFPIAAKKIVLGTGWGGYTAPPVVDESWDIRCVRGPLTAQALGLPATAIAGDAAILIRNHYTPAPEKRVKVSFMPHFLSIPRGHWQAACKLAGIRFIDPRLPIETILGMLCESEIVITEAMHGAIVSDALRVPWIAMKPIDPIHHMKWNDWAGALDLEVRFRFVRPSSAREKFLRKHGGESWHLEHSSGWRPLAAKPIDAVSIFMAATSLSRVARAEPQLSSDAAIALATDRLQAAADGLLQDHTAA